MDIMTKKFHHPLQASLSGLIFFVAQGHGLIIYGLLGSSPRNSSDADCKPQRCTVLFISSLGEKIRDPVCRVDAGAFFSIRKHFLYFFLFIHAICYRAKKLQRIFHG
jgi:hypothetical protein